MEVKTNSILEFFVAAAVRKGATALPKQLKLRSVEYQCARDKNVYVIRYHIPSKFEFTIHCDGRWTYEAGEICREGKLQPPHAKSWVAKMLNKGVPGELARQDWERYRKLRNGQN